MRVVVAILGAEAVSILYGLYHPPSDELVGFYIVAAIIALAAFLMYWVSRGGGRR